MIVPKIRYAGGQLDRAARLRQDDDWISAAFVDDAAVAVLIYNDQNLIAGLSSREEIPRAALVPLSTVRDSIAENALTWAFLGLDGETPVFVVDLSANAIAALPSLGDAGEFVDLRRAGWLVSEDDAALLAYARALMLWHRRHHFCSVCGSPAENRRAGHVRRCTNALCATDSFPRTDPVVIMLVIRPATHERPARALLGRHSRLPKGAYSILAGFVEPGESFEDAVAREVMEETGVRVADTTYVASQPWPFPYSMMTGFRAIAETEDIAIDPDEIEDAQWFTASELAGFGEWGDTSDGFKLPRKDSIARALLDEWIRSERRLVAG